MVKPRFHQHLTQSCTSATDTPQQIHGSYLSLLLSMPQLQPFPLEILFPLAHPGRLGNDDVRRQHPSFDSVLGEVKVTDRRRKQIWRSGSMDDRKFSGLPAVQRRSGLVVFDWGETAVGSLLRRSRIRFQGRERRWLILWGQGHVLCQEQTSTANAAKNGNYYIFSFNIQSMFTSKVWTDDNRLLQESSLTERQPCRAPHQVIRGGDLEGAWGTVPPKF